MSSGHQSFAISNQASAPIATEARIAGLDGLRGLMTIVVLVSHYFGELPGGFRVFMLGWIAVDVFFVLSGFLVGRLILDKGDRDNFLRVFYIRRVCRTFPIYFTCVIGAYALISWQNVSWNDMDHALPFWSYLTFTQNILFAMHTSTGAHWISPTWTMAIEEQFYLIAPALMLFVPARRIVPVLLAIAIGAVVFRFACVALDWPKYTSLSLLPARADTLALGLLAAVLFVRQWWQSERIILILRCSIPALVLAVVAIKILGPSSGILLTSLGFGLISLAAAIYVFIVACGAPEAKSLEKKWFAFFCHNSFAIYLTHMPVLWLTHGWVLGQKPSIETIHGLLITMLAIPICLGLSRLLTRYIEEPCMAFGRSFSWSPKRI
jgi:peptidoglycan/LPS O-acetylase OafA/YrhL